MKNTIPLIIAVVFGLVAVLAVSRTLSQKENARGKTVQVLTASHALKAGDTLEANDFIPKDIPADVYITGQQVRWEDRNMVDGLKLSHDVAQRSFIMMGDFEVEDAPSSDVGIGEWAVPVHFADTALLGFIQPGDEIAIVLWLRTQKEEFLSSNAGDGKKTVVQQEMCVLFPRKRVMNKMGNGVLLSLSREEAMTLLIAQRKGELYPVLRRRGDSGSNPDIPDPLPADKALSLETLRELNKKSLGE